MENSQKVRHIPIFVEGRDEPIINKDHNTQQNSANANSNASAQNSANSTASAFASAESSSGPFQSHQNPYFQNQNHTSFGRPPMNFSDMDDMGFGDMNMPHHGSIFERAKDFPVRTDFPDFFSNVRSASPSNRRSESPSNHQQPKKSPSGGATPNVHNLRQSGSGERPVPVQHENVRRASTPQRQETPPKQPPPPQQPQQQQVPVQQVPIPQQQPQQTEEQRAAAAKQKALEDSITKIQKIQQSVLDLMGRVEKYDGIDRKEYLYLDEMLTQNLLKLDNIDAEGKDNIKNARREAIKCINSLISLLEAKNEEATHANNNNNSNGVEKSKSNESATQPEASVDQNNVEQAQPTQELNGASKNSSYDNVNQVQQETSLDVPEKSAEAILEQKIAEAMSKQDDGQKQT